MTVPRPVVSVALLASIVAGVLAGIRLFAFFTGG